MTLLILVAAVGGVAVALQGQAMGLIDRTLGTRESVFITYGSGALLAAAVMLLARGGNLRVWREVPLYAYSSGLLGLVIVGAIGYAVPRLGLTKALIVIIVAQLAAAALIDHFGVMGATQQTLTIDRWVGIGVLLLGAWLTLR